MHATLVVLIDREHEEQTVKKLTRSLSRIKEQQAKLNQSDAKDAVVLAESSEHFEGLFKEKTWKYTFVVGHEEHLPAAGRQRTAKNAKKKSQLLVLSPTT